MKSWNSDKLMVGISAIIISTFSLLLFLDFTARIDAGEAREIGTITYKKKVSQRKYGTQVIWESIDQNSPVYINDSIRTAELSQAVIHLADGTSIELDENSMILLAESAGAININFAQGTMYAKRGDVTGKDAGAVNIVSGGASISIEKSDVKISQAENQDVNLTVSRGTAVLKTGGEDKVLSVNQSAVILKDSAVAEIREVKLRLVSPEPNRFFIASGAGSSVSFSWEDPGDVKDAYLEIARDGMFTNKIAVKKVSGTGSTEFIGGGQYYWRIGAEVSGRKEYSESRKINVIADSPVRLIQPGNNEKFSFVTTSPLINFRWGENNLAVKYILEIASDSDFKKTVGTYTTPLTGLGVDTLPEGSFFWRVRTSVALGDPSYSGSSPVHRFMVERKRELERVSLTAPPDGNNLSELQFKTSGAVFGWKALGQISRYEMVIASDSEFKNTVHTEEVNGNFIRLVKDLSPGSYFWKVRPLAGDAEGAVFSPPRSFTVAGGEGVSLVSPADKAELDPRGAERYTPVDFTWSKAPIEGRYYFELADDEGFSKIIHKAFSSANKIKVRKVESGKYFWRVRMMDQAGKDIVKSPVFEVTVKEPEKREERPTLVVYSPVRNGAIYINGKLAGYGTVKSNPNPGRISVAVTAPGYKKYEKSIAIAVGEKQELRAEMEKEEKDERVKWTQNLGSSVSSRPVMHKNMVVTATGKGTVYGLSRGGGRVWQTDLKGNLESTPVVDDSGIYIVNTKGELFCINPANGRIKWKKNVEGPLLFSSSPVIAEGKVFVATSFGAVMAFSNDGKDLWRKDLAGGVFSSPAYHDGTLYIGTDDRKLYALHSKDGRPKWQFDIDSRMVSSSPLVHRGKVFAGCYSGAFYAVDIATGRQVWIFRAGGPILSSPVTHQDLIYTGSMDGKLHALNIETGSVKWSYDAGEKILTGPEIEGGKLYLTSQRTVHMLSPLTGGLEWKIRMDSPIKTPPTISGNDIFVGLENGKVVTLRSDTRIIVR